MFGNQSPGDCFATLLLGNFLLHPCSRRSGKLTRASLVIHTPPEDSVIQAKIDEMDIIYTLFTLRGTLSIDAGQTEHIHDIRQFQCNYRG